MDDSLETFVPLLFRRKGSRRLVTDDRHVHDVTLLKGWRGAFIGSIWSTPGRCKAAQTSLGQKAWTRPCPTS